MAAGAAGFAALGSSWSRDAVAQPAPAREDVMATLLRDQRSLWMVRDGDEIRTTWWSARSGYDHDQYLALCWFMRDRQAQRVFVMDRALLDVLAGVQAWLQREGVKAPIQLHSGYRTQRTNNRTEGAALASRHVQGQAADISVEGVAGAKLAGFSMLLGRGGTGFYLQRGFVHVDTGDQRAWVDPKRKG